MADAPLKTKHNLCGEGGIQIFEFCDTVPTIFRSLVAKFAYSLCICHSSVDPKIRHSLTNLFIICNYPFTSLNISFQKFKKKRFRCLCLYEFGRAQLRRCIVPDAANIFVKLPASLLLLGDVLSMKPLIHLLNCWFC